MIFELFLSYKHVPLISIKNMSACSLLFAHNKIRWCMFLAWYHIFFQLRFCDHRRKQDRTNSSLTPSQTILTALHSSISWQRITTDHKTWRGPGVSNRTFGHRTKSNSPLPPPPKKKTTTQRKSNEIERFIRFDGQTISNSPKNVILTKRKKSFNY